MQLSPQAFPFLQTLQQLPRPEAAQAGDAQLMVEGPEASAAAAARSVINFTADSPRHRKLAHRQRRNNERA